MPVYYYECEKCGNEVEQITKDIDIPHPAPERCDQLMKQEPSVDSKRLEIERQPGSFYDWPSEIRRLYYAVIFAVITNESEARDSALKGIFELIKQQQDRKLAETAHEAFWELSLRLDPEILKGHVANLYGARGESVIELATKFLSFAPDEKSRRIGERQLELLVSAFSPGKRA